MKFKDYEKENDDDDIKEFFGEIKWKQQKNY